MKERRQPQRGFQDGWNLNLLLRLTVLSVTRPAQSILFSCDTHTSAHLKYLTALHFCRLRLAAVYLVSFVSYVQVWAPVG